jgi:hypothetical protein
VASHYPNASSCPAPSPALGHAVGTRIGDRYQVVEQLGRGGMAVVYRVRDGSRAEEVALKQLVLRTAADEHQLRAQLEREFCVLAQLSHPSVIEVYDYGVEAFGPYYTMELLDGGDLSEQAPMEVRRVCELALQLCSSLSLLHSRKLVHRDVSPRNVRCTPKGSAKLIDFGAMAPMGPCVQVVGTPSFVAPEVVHHLGLDARTDLFSLGATLYFALTGRKPFAARTLADLHDAWREQPAAPSHFVPAIPAALDALVLSLLCIDPDRRPRSAFEVIQRLAAIAGISQAEPEQLAEAYLSRPELIGREAEQRRFRQRLRMALQGETGSLIFEAQPGLGRTRLLDMCAIEAKLAGATVLRVNGRAALRTPLAGAYSLAEQLLENLPDLAAARARDASIDSELLFCNSHGSAPPGVPQLRALEALDGDRARAQSELSRWLCAVCELRPLVLALDDIERIDEASLAWIAGLSHGARRLRMLIVATLPSSTDTSLRPALSALREHALKLTLSPLTAAQTEALFASMFSDAPHVALLSHRVHRVAAGNLRESMALTRFMLDRKLIRYAEAKWSLPAELALTELPASAEEAVRARVASLPALARRIAQSQALAFEGPWTRSDYLQIAKSESASAVDDALATLVRQAILVDNGSSYTLSHLGVRACLLGGMSERELACAHLVLAELCVRSGRPVIVEVHHWLLAGCAEQGLERLALLFKSISGVAFLYEASGLERRTVAAILERAKLSTAERRRPARESHELNLRLIELSLTTDEALYHAHAASWLAQLELDSGFYDYERTSPELNRAERLDAALQLAAARYAATPERDRVYRCDEAIRLLAHFVTMSYTISAKTSDARLADSLHVKLEPFAGLSPLLDALYQYSFALRQYQCKAQPEQARDRLLEIHARLEHIEGSDFPHFYSLRQSVASALAVLETMLGYRSAEDWIRMSESYPLQRLRALNLRRTLCIFDGDTLGAERSRKQAELLTIQTDGRGLAPAPLYLELLARLHVGDLAGVKHVADRAEQLASKAPGWLALQQLAQASFQRMRGDLPAALAAIQRALALASPADADATPQLSVWVLAAAEHVTILTELDRADEARAVGVKACERCAALEIVGLAASLQRALALAEAKLGECERAAARLDALIEQRALILPAFLAADYEARARVAIHAKDVNAAERFARLATRHPASTSGPRVQHGRLFDEAKRAGLALDVSVSGFESTVLGVMQPAQVAGVFRDRLASLGELPDRAARAQRALVLLAEAAGGRTGYLYYVTQGQLSCVAREGAAPDPGLDRFANGYLQQQLDGAAMTTIFTEINGVSPPGIATWTSQAGTVFRIALLQAGAQDTVVGLVALSGVAPVALSPEYRSLSRALSARALELGDVSRSTAP